MRRCAGLLVGLIACTSGRFNLDKDETGDSADQGGGPSVTDADVWCYEHTGSDPYVYYWVVRVDVDAYEGTELASFTSDAVKVYEGSTEVYSVALACDEVRCTTSFTEDQSGVDCGTPTAYTFEITVTDVDGNVSGTYSVTGRAGSSAEG